MVRSAISRHGISLRFACTCLRVSTSVYYYAPKLDAHNERIAAWLLQLTQTHRRWGFGLCFLYLRNVKGFGWNHKRVYRIYQQLELNLRIKPKRRIQREQPKVLDVPSCANEVWSMDFMSDALADGRTLRTFNVMDDYNREGLSIDVDLSLPSQRVIRALEQVIQWRGKPQRVRCDNGPEFISANLNLWAKKHGIKIDYIQPGKPTQNAYIERFNRTARHEWLDMHEFESVEQAQLLATKWLWQYNNERPHSAIGGVPPRYLMEHGVNNSTSKCS